MKELIDDLDLDQEKEITEDPFFQDLKKYIRMTIQPELTVIEDKLDEILENLNSGN